MTFKVSILWGEAPENGQEANTYEFESQELLDAFIQGVEEAEGWLGYEVVTEGHIHGAWFEVQVFAMTDDGEGGLRIAQRGEDFVQYDVIARRTVDSTGEIDELEEFEFQPNQLEAASAKADELADKYICDVEFLP